MYIITSLNPTNSEKNNTAESGAYANYISKYNDGYLFNSKLELVPFDEAAEHIDKHSRGGIRKGEAKWYSPTYCLSSEECLHIVSSILEFGTIESRKIFDFEQLTKSEQLKYNQKIQDLALKFQKEMALNFNKQDLGINTEHDLIWYGSIEHVRKYKGYDRQVKNGYKNVGEKKFGFHTHIHILQSRKANNEKKSLISPQANARTKTHQNAGFDRNIFYNRIEKVFDTHTLFKRRKERTFEYFKKKKKERQQTEHTTEEYKKVNRNTKPKYIPRNELKDIITNSNCIQYFNSLVEKNEFLLKEKKGFNYIFQDKNNPKDLYFVNKKGWHNPNKNESGGIINAINKLDNYDWNQSIQHILYLNRLNFDADNLNVPISQKSIQYSELRSIKNLLYLKQRRIFDINYAKEYLKENHSNTGINLYLKNDSGGWHDIVSKTVNGQNDILSIVKSNSNTYHLFNNILDYLEYKQQNKEEINSIILNSPSNFHIASRILKNKNIVDHTNISKTNQKKYR